MSEPVASLGMYDGGALAGANDVLWDAIARRLDAHGVSAVPRVLDRARALDDIWASEGLLLGQICGYPFAARFRGRLRLIAAPRYSVPGCIGSHHQSFIVVHARRTVRGLAELRGARAVLNDVESMTGRHLLGDAFADAGAGEHFFESVEVSGSHANSLADVAAGRADVAAIDCVSFAHLARTVPEIVAETRIVHRSRQTPTLPFVMSSALDEATKAAVARAFDEALVDPSTADARRSLMLVGAEPLHPSAYDAALGVAARADRVFGQSLSGLRPAGAPLAALPSLSAGDGWRAAGKAS